MPVALDLLQNAAEKTLLTAASAPLGLGRPFGEDRLGPRTRAALGFGEGLLFGAGLAAGLTRRPRHRSDG